MQSLQTLIPSAKINAVENALLSAFNTTVPDDIVLLTGGLSVSAVYKIVVNGLPYVLKLDAPVEHIDDAPTCMQIAANASFAPQVIYLNKAEGVTITAFIAGVPLNTAFKTKDELLPLLAVTIRRIHRLPLFTKESSLADIVNGLIYQFRSAGTLTGPAFDECFGYYDAIKKSYPWDDPDRVSSHNDLNPNNMIYDGQKLWVIDWDAAFKNDRYADLAIMANFYVTTDEQESIFLGAYFGEQLNDYNMARFFIMRQVCFIVYAILMFKLADSNKPAGVEHNVDMQNITLATVKKQLGNGELSIAAYNGQLQFGKAMFNEVLYNMRSPRFNSAIGLL